MKARFSVYTNLFVILAFIFLLGFSFIVTSWVRVNKMNKANAMILPEFELVDQHGMHFSKANMLNKYTLIFFGFSRCPSICPMMLQNLTTFLNKVKGKDYFNDLQVVFVTVDPENDTQDVLLNYSKNFDSKILMLTGETKHLKELINSYRVYVSHDKKTGEINHSSVLYFIGKKSEFIGAVDITNEDDFYCDIKQMMK